MVATSCPCQHHVGGQFHRVFLATQPADDVAVDMENCWMWRGKWKMWHGTWLRRWRGNIVGPLFRNAGTIFVVYMHVLFGNCLFMVTLRWIRLCLQSCLLEHASALEREYWTICCVIQLFHWALQFYTSTYRLSYRTYSVLTGFWPLLFAVDMTHCLTVPDDIINDRQ